MRLKIVLIFLLVCGLSVNAQKYSSKIKINKDIELTKISDSIFIHTSWFEFPKFGRFPSNGLILVKNGKALLVDTPNDNAQTEILAEYLLDSMSIKIEKVIVCHFHSDCMGGLEYLHRKNIESVSLDLTKKICKKKQLPIPKETFSKKLTFNFYGEKVICQYFGAGHTIDNIVVYFPNSKILFGGCLIKSSKSIGLGNLADAVVNDWDISVMKLVKEFTDVKTVVPGHGGFGGKELMNHTIELVEKHKEK